jgi:hypothetical protein
MKLSFWSALIHFSLVGLGFAAPAQYVIQISVDGLRADLLKSLVSPTSSPLSAFKKLVQEGAATYAARCDYNYSETVPNHATMITGRPVTRADEISLQHGYTNNFPATTDTLHTNGSPVGYKFSAFDVVHDRSLTTALLAGKARLAILGRSYDATNGALDLISPDDGRNKFTLVSTTDTSTANLVTTLVNRIAANTLPNYTFLHIVEPDTAGHSGNWGSSGWNTAITTVDTQLGRIFTALDSQAAIYGGKVCLLLTADHGGGGPAGTANNHTDASAIANVTIPFFAWGPGFRAGANLYDLLSNRFEPAPNVRPEYTEVRQPLRNGDAANLSMALLGLPSIPGSSLIPELALLEIKPEAGQITLQWPSAALTHVLESATDLAGTWIPITSGIEEANGYNRLTVNPQMVPKRFYRLRKL